MIGNDVNFALISGPSGSGKDSVIEKVMQRLSGIGLSISCTTRGPRLKQKEGIYEQHGVDYFFYDKPEFEELIRCNAFLEYANNKGDWYGTPREYVEKLCRDGNDVIILNIENEGMAQMKALNPMAVSIFILPPSAQELRRRLIGRKSGETPEDIERRFEKGREQLRMAYAYDYVVLNDDLEKAAQEVASIICAMRRRTMLHKKLIDEINATFIEE